MGRSASAMYLLRAEFLGNTSAGLPKSWPIVVHADTRQRRHGSPAGVC